MANTAHLFRRQSSRDLNGSHHSYTKTLDELELKVQINDFLKLKEENFKLFTQNISLAS